MGGIEFSAWVESSSVRGFSAIAGSLASISSEGGIYSVDRFSGSGGALSSESRADSGEVGLSSTALKSSRVSASTLLPSSRSVRFAGSSSSASASPKDSRK